MAANGAGGAGPPPAEGGGLPVPDLRNMEEFVPIWANPKGKLKAITTQSGLVLDGPSVPIPPPFINLEEDERAEEILTDQDNSEFTIKVPPPSVQQAKLPKQRNFVIHPKSLVSPHAWKPFLRTSRAFIEHSWDKKWIPPWTVKTS
ncbi:hypothetical protein Tco_0921332 [Tanacetum coccineum]